MSATTTPRPNFHDRVDMEKLRAGLARHNIQLTDDEYRRMAQSIETHTRGFEGSEALGGDNIGLSITRYVYFFIYLIQNIGGNTAGLSMENFTQWASDRFGQSFSGTEHAMIDQATMAIHGDLVAAGGNLARAATLVTGQRAAGSNLPLADMPESVFRQIEAAARPLTQEQAERGTSLNGAGTRFNVANVTDNSAPLATGQANNTSGLTPANS